MTPTYHIRGLVVRSEIALAAAAGGSGPASIDVRRGSVATDLGPSGIVAGDWQVDAGRALLDVPRVARFLVDGASHVTVEPWPFADVDVLTRYLAGEVLDVALMGRGTFALNGTVCGVREHDLILLGASRAVVADAASQIGGVQGAKTVFAVPLSAIGPVDQTVATDGVRVCIVQPMVPRSAVPELVSMPPFQVLTTARGLVRAHAMIDALGLEAQLMRALAEAFAGRDVAELRWPLRALSRADIEAWRTGLVGDHVPMPAISERGERRA